MRLEKKFGWMDLIQGMMLIFLSFIILQNPEVSLLGSVLTFGIVGVVSGIKNLVLFFMINSKIHKKSWILVLMGILDIMVGVMLMTNLYVGVLSIAILLPTWILVSSLVGLMNNSIIKFVSRTLYWIRIVFYVLSIILSVLMFMQPASSIVSFVLLLGFNVLSLGVIHIIEAFEGYYIFEQH
ncbi:MAG: DUF308 domain-containing protein [Erysipelothrix sp.]